MLKENGFLIVSSHLVMAVIFLQQSLLGFCCSRQIWMLMPPGSCSILHLTLSLLLSFLFSAHFHKNQQHGNSCWWSSLWFLAQPGCCEHLQVGRFSIFHSVPPGQVLSWFHFRANWLILQIYHCSCSTLNCWYLWLCACCFQYQSSLKPGSVLKVNSKHGRWCLSPRRKWRRSRHVLFHLDTERSEQGGRKQAAPKRRVSGVSCQAGSNGSNERATLKCRERRT